MCDFCLLSSEQQNEFTHLIGERNNYYLTYENGMKRGGTKETIKIRRGDQWSPACKDFKFCRNFT